MAIKQTDIKKEKARLIFLKNLLKNKENEIAKLFSLDNGNSHGLSEYFTALAKNTIEDVWFKEINILDGGEKLFLSGYTTDAEYVPQMITVLKKEDIFKGVNFKLFKAKFNKKEKLIYFILKTENELLE